MGPRLLLLDVDGCLAPFPTTLGGRALPYDDERSWGDWEPHDLQPFGLDVTVVLSRRLGDALAGLPAERRWCTSWFEEANTHLAPLLGWAELPVVGGGDPDRSLDPPGVKRRAGEVAARDVLEAGGRVVWVDDHEHVTASAPDGTLVLVPDVHAGITPAMVDEIGAFLDA